MTDLSSELSERLRPLKDQPVIRQLWSPTSSLWQQEHLRDAALLTADRTVGRDLQAASNGVLLISAVLQQLVPGQIAPFMTN